MKITVENRKINEINPDMIGLFFEDINYAADGGLNAELIENRNFSFVKAMGDWNDYYTVPANDYAWRISDDSKSEYKIVKGSPLSEINNEYIRIWLKDKNCKLINKAYEGISVEKGKKYNLVCFIRNVSYDSDFSCKLFTADSVSAKVVFDKDSIVESTYNRWNKYSVSFTANEDACNAEFALEFNGEGIVEVAYVSLIPGDAVAGVFRKDLFDKLYDLKPRFIRFPGGCIVEGNTLSNRYRFKDTLTEPWNRKTNWNRWAVHMNSESNNFESEFAHYNQTYGIGFYEFFLLCELLGAKPLPVFNVGFACQYQSTEMVDIESEEFKGFVNDALDLIEFANGDVSTKWGSLREKMGHANPFNLDMLGIGNEQWQTKKADFFERYSIFEKEIHKIYPDMKLIGSAGPDVTSERYTMAWDFYRKNKGIKNFAYALDEHYYVKPEWMFENNDFYDDYDREIKVFSGEYAAHPHSGLNRYDANNLWGALAEASFMTGLERNCDVVVLASYAPLFARINYSQWAPDMIWFDGKDSYGTPSFYVQKLFSNNMGDYTLPVNEIKDAVKDGIYYSLSYDLKSKERILKVVNSNEKDVDIEILGDVLPGTIKCSSLAGRDKEDCNSIDNPSNVCINEYQEEYNNKITVKSLSFNVYRF